MPITCASTLMYTPKNFLNNEDRMPRHSEISPIFQEPFSTKLKINPAGASSLHNYKKGSKDIKWLILTKFAEILLVILKHNEQNHFISTKMRWGVESIYIERLIENATKLSCLSNELYLVIHDMQDKTLLLYCRELNLILAFVHLLYLAKLAILNYCLLLCSFVEVS